jgi:hypothetical protein
MPDFGYNAPRSPGKGLLRRNWEMEGPYVPMDANSAIMGGPIESAS